MRSHSITTDPWKVFVYLDPVFVSFVNDVPIDMSLLCTAQFAV